MRYSAAGLKRNELMQDLQGPSKTVVELFNKSFRMVVILLQIINIDKANFDRRIWPPLNYFALARRNFCSNLD